MNNQDLAIKRNNTARLFQHTDKMHRNSVRFSSGNSFQHELAKFFVCWLLKQKGKEFLTEATFEDRSGRADIVVLDDSEVIEILWSEDYAAAIMKAMKYPIKKHEFINAERAIASMLSDRPLYLSEATG